METMLVYLDMRNSGRGDCQALAEPTPQAVKAIISNTGSASGAHLQPLAGTIPEIRQKRTRRSITASKLLLRLEQAWGEIVQMSTPG